MEESKMLITDIEPIDKWGKNLLKEEEYNAEKLIDAIIEAPLRTACRIFRQKGIQTVMSSANKNNVLKAGEKPIEKQDVYGSGQQFREDRPTYEDAGKGYAWIMLDFDTLSDENKDWLFSLEERKGNNGEPLGEKAIWFVHPCEIGNIEYSLKIGAIDYDLLEQTIPQDKIPRGIEIDDKLVEFEKRHIVLSYHWGMYPRETVIIRMPVNENTTVEEVETYFAQFAKSFKSQVKGNESPKLEENDIEIE